MPVFEKLRQKRFLGLYLAPFLLYCWLIFYLSSRSDLAFYYCRTAAAGGYNLREIYS